MDPCREYNSLPVGYVFRNTPEIGNYEHVDIVTSQTLAQDGLSYLIPGGRNTGLADEFAKISVSVGITVGEVDRVFIVLGSVFKSKTVILLSITIIRWL